jgi:hypothetical protein
LMHVAGADGTDQGLGTKPPEGEGDENKAIPDVSDGQRAALCTRMRRVWVDGAFTRKQRFDLGAGDTMLAAFRPVPGIPVES